MKDISAGATAVLADVFPLYLKTKNFHWHMSGSHFRDYHLLLDEHGDELFAMTDPLAERVRKVGGSTLRSIGDISRKQRIADNVAVFVHPHEMLAELRDNNGSLIASMRSLHNVCDEYNDVATASLPENWIDETEKRVWFLFETLSDTNGLSFERRGCGNPVPVGLPIAAFLPMSIDLTINHSPTEWMSRGILSNATISERTTPSRYGHRNMGRGQCAVGSGSRCGRISVGSAGAL